MRAKADRPQLARKGARGATFTAALEQAEQLRGAAEISPVASPLLLFYGLGQAGRAICAAGTRGDQWPSIHRHGLRFKLTEPPRGSAPALGAIGVEPDGSGLLQQVADVLTSPALQTAVDLGTLIASFPGGDTFPAKLLPEQASRPIAVDHAPSIRAAFLLDVPSDLTSYGSDWAHHPEGAEVTADRLTEWLRPYPRLPQLGAPRDVSVSEWQIGTDGRLVATRVFATWENCRLGVGEAGAWAAEHLDIVTSRGGVTQSVSGLVKPAIAGNDAAHHELVSWWLTLSAFSMLARYQPREWTLLLDVDNSPLAVPIERLLQIARESVPAVILEVLKYIKDLDDA